MFLSQEQSEAIHEWLDRAWNMSNHTIVGMIYFGMKYSGVNEPWVEDCFQTLKEMNLLQGLEEDYHNSQMVVKALEHEVGYLLLQEGDTDYGIPVSKEEIQKSEMLFAAVSRLILRLNDMES